MNGSVHLSGVPIASQGLLLSGIIKFERNNTECLSLWDTEPIRNHIKTRVLCLCTDGFSAGRRWLTIYILYTDNATKTMGNCTLC